MENSFETYPYKNSEMLEKMESMNIDRNLSTYLSISHYDLGDLKGKKILDVGSGAGVFAVEAKRSGLDVVAMDPAYKYNTGIDWLKKTVSSNSTWKEKIEALIKKKNLDTPSPVCADSKNCPFIEESFDIIFNLCSAYFYCTSPEDLRDIFLEQLRILKTGGEITIFPIQKFSKYAEDKNVPIKINYREVMLGISAYNIHLDNHELKDAIKSEFRLILEEIGNNPNFKISLFDNRDDTESFSLRIKKLASNY